MSKTLSEYQKLTTNKAEKETYLGILTADMLVERLKFRGTSGNAHQWNRRTTHPTTTVHTVGDQWESTYPAFTQKTSALKTIGTQSGVDLFARDTLSGDVSQEAVVKVNMSESFGRELARLVIKGDSAVNALEFDGLDKLVRADTRMMAMDDGEVDGPGTAETELTLDRLDAMIDLIWDGKKLPDALIMNTTMRRKLSALFRAAGSGVLPTETTAFGHKVEMYSGIPIIITNHITNAETYADSGTWTSSTATTIFAVTFGEENEGYTILHNGPVLKPQVTPLGIRRDAHEEEWRMYAYLSSMVPSKFSIAALGGIDSAS